MKWHKNDRQGEKDGSGGEGWCWVVLGGVGWGRLKTGKVYVAKFTKNEMEML